MICFSEVRMGRLRVIFWDCTICFKAEARGRWKWLFCGCFFSCAKVSCFEAVCSKPCQRSFYTNYVMLYCWGVDYLQRYLEFYIVYFIHIKTRWEQSIRIQHFIRKAPGTWNTEFLWWEVSVLGIALLRFSAGWKQIFQLGLSSPICFVLSVITFLCLVLWLWAASCDPVDRLLFYSKPEYLHKNVPSECFLSYLSVKLSLPFAKPFYIPLFISICSMLIC